MSEIDETVGRCAFCESDENITFLVLPNSSNLVAVCARCSLVLEEAREHLAKSTEWDREQERQRIDEMRFISLLAVLLASVGCSLQWGVGVGLAVAGGILALYVTLRGME